MTIATLSFIIGGLLRGEGLYREYVRQHSASSTVRRLNGSTWLLVERVPFGFLTLNFWPVNCLLELFDQRVSGARSDFARKRRWVERHTNVLGPAYLGNRTYLGQFKMTAATANIPLRVGRRMTSLSDAQSAPVWASLEFDKDAMAFSARPRVLTEMLQRWLPPGAFGGIESRFVKAFVKQVESRLPHSR